MSSDDDAEIPVIDTSKPHVARIYDYYLGGKSNFAADREAAGKALAAVPDSRNAAQHNRGFLRRAVQYLVAEAGIRQFLDIGTGLPARDNTHEVAQRAAADCRIVYVDNDPIVLAHARALLTSRPEGRTAYIHADLRDPAAILNHPVTRNVLDFSQPVALMLVAVLHFIPDEDKPAQVVAALRDALPSGSFIVASHILRDDMPAEAMQRIEVAYEPASAPAVFRDSSAISRFFDDLTLVEPGLVPVTDWRPDSPPGAPITLRFLGGVGRKA